MSELTNWGRADFAATALQAYYAETRHDSDTYGDEGDGGAMEEAFGDLLGDLQHLADRAGLDFDAMLDRGRGYHAEEVAEEQHREEQASA